MAYRIVVLAAGKGTRMRSSLPKVLHSLGGKPLLAHVLDAALALEPRGIVVVVGHEARQVRDALSPVVPERVTWVEQARQLGTADAVRVALPAVEEDDTVLVVFGDTPLVTPHTCRALLEAAADDRLALLTLELDDPSGYGRILRDADDRIVGIVEQKDADPAQQRIREINSGVMAIGGAHLQALLPRIDNDNAQGEYYLTDLVKLAVADGLEVVARAPVEPCEVDGVNDRVQLATLERHLQRRLAVELMRSGTSLRDPARVDIRGDLVAGEDCEIDVDCVFLGDCRLGRGVSIGPGCVIVDSVLGAGTVVHAHSIIERAELGEACVIGPFARLRPGTRLDNEVKVGNFVETKQVEVGAGSKINHLSYIGDASLGRDVNVGAGTITCNYDGANKHRTTVGDAVFIGSNTALVAPIDIGTNATIGAGSTLSGDVSPDTLALTRASRRDLTDWTRPSRDKRDD